MSNPKNEPRASGSPARGGVRWRGPLLALALVMLAAAGVLAVRYYLDRSGELVLDRSGELVTSAGREGAPLIGGPFTLVDQDNRTVTDADFRGRWLLVFFGYTYCPDVCPTSLARNVDAIDLLGDKGEKVTPVLISVDPQRDTPEKLKDYVHVFHPRAIGLTGTPEQIAAVAKEYRVYYAQAPQQDPQQYLVDHSSLTYLIGPDGRFVQFFRHETSAQQMAERLNALL